VLALHLFQAKIRPKSGQIYFTVHQGIGLNPSFKNISVSRYPINQNLHLTTC